MTTLEQLSIFKLGHGDHVSPDEGLCAMEAVAWLEGLEHTDHPECTCPVIAAYVRRFNDNLDDEGRQKLVAYLPRLVGTVSKEHELERAEYLAWQAIRVFAPIALRKIGLEAEAKKLADFKGTLAEASKEARSYATAAAAAYAYAAAAAAADAADATAYATAADTAATAATAAAYAADADATAAFKALDGVLAIGPQSKGFSQDTEIKVEAYRELIGA